MKLSIVNAKKSCTIDEVLCGSVFSARASRNEEVHYYMKVDHGNGVFVRGTPTSNSKRYAVNLQTGQLRAFDKFIVVDEIFSDAELRI